MSRATNPVTTLRIAVTGHRDLAPRAVAPARAALRDAITALAAQCHPATIEIMTGMADGADQLAADVAEELGHHLRISLPKPLDDYTAELSASSAARLEELWSRPDVSTSLVIDARTDGVDDPESAPYETLGIHLARSAHVLIAVWDGHYERKPGGTLDVMARFLDHDAVPGGDGELPSPIETTGDTADLPGPVVVWVPTTRAGDGANPPDPATPTAPCHVIATGIRGTWRLSDEMPPALAEMLHDLGLVADVAGRDHDGGGYPLLDAMPDGLDPSRRAAAEDIHAAYLEADRLALTQQSRSDLSFVGAAFIAAAMGFAFLWFAKIDDHIAWLYAYLALFVAGYLLYRVARAGHWLRLHLSLRVLAETLRVQFFMTILGLADRVDTRRLLAATGVSSFPGFAWAAESDRIGVPLTHHAGPGPTDMRDLARVEWIHDQFRYFRTKVTQLHARHKRLEQVQIVLYVLSFITVVVIIAFGTDLKKVHGPGDVSLKTILIFLMGLLPLWLTLWELHQGRMATREMLWQFGNQAEIFRRADAELRDVDDQQAVESAFVELAERSLFEAYLWTIHRFHREFAPPSGG